MNIVTDINLNKYSPYMIIEMIEQEVVTVDEVVRSGVAYRFFTNVLSDYLNMAISRQLEDTLIINRRSTDV